MKKRQTDNQLSHFEFFQLETLRRERIASPSSTGSHRSLDDCRTTGIFEAIEEKRKRNGGGGAGHGGVKMGREILSDNISRASNK